MSLDVIRRVLGRELGREPRRLTPLSGGCVGEVYLVEVSDGERLVAKVDRSSSGTLDVEGYMLERLAPHLPVPAVVHADANLLLMEWLPGSQGCDDRAQEHAASLLASLHGVTRDRCGLEQDTLIGGLSQPNPEGRDWVSFFAEHRLLHMARLAHQRGNLDGGTLRRVELVADRLGTWIDEPREYSLLHGDVWSGNVLSAGGRVTGFLDPAVYFGHPEVELAFIAMFQTFGRRFFAAYQEQRGIAPGFFEERKDLYNLYPYLVHTRLFGGSYLLSVQRILQRFVD